MSGLHLLRDIKRLDSTIADIMVTGSDNVALAAEAVENGAAAFVRKPFDLGHLDRLVTEILAKSGRWRPEDIRKAYRVLQAIFGKAS